MKNRSNLLFLWVISLLVITALACQAVSQATPTPEPTLPPAPTATQEASPTPSPAPTETPLPTATEPPPPTETSESVEEKPTETLEAEPGQLNILTVNGYLDESGDLHVVGLISNDTDRALNDIEVEVEIFDAAGNSLYKEITVSSLYELAPGDISPFQLWVYDDIPDADHYAATIAGYGSTESVRAELDVQNVNSVIDDYDDLYVTGEVVNNSSDPVALNGIAAAVFDSDGTLISVGSDSVRLTYLAPGESGPFRINFTFPPEQVENFDQYKFYMDASVMDEPQMTYPLTFSESHYNYVDTFGNFHLVGSLRNDSDVDLNISLLGTIYDEGGFVLDVSNGSLPYYSIEPGQTVPYDIDFWGPLNYTSGLVEKADNYLVQIDWYWTWESYTKFVDVITTEDDNTFDDYQGTFTGKVVNNSGGEVNSATVIVSLYDKASGELVATDYTWVSGPIANNDSAEYTVYISIPEDFDVNTVEFEIIAKAELP